MFGRGIVSIEEAVSPRICHKPKRKRTGQRLFQASKHWMTELLYHIQVSKSIQWIHQPQSSISFGFRIQEVNWINKLNLDRSFQATLPIQNYIAQFSLNYIYRPTHWDILEWLNRSSDWFSRQDCYVGYCICCRYSSKESSPFAEPTEFSDWQHATGERYGLTLHKSSVEHLRCLMECLQFKIREKEGKQVTNLINS